MVRLPVLEMASGAETSADAIGSCCKTEEDMMVPLARQTRDALLGKTVGGDGKQSTGDVQEEAVITCGQAMAYDVMTLQLN